MTDNRTMTVKQLRDLLVDVPDDYTVMLDIPFHASNPNAPCSEYLVFSDIDVESESISFTRQP